MTLLPILEYPNDLLTKPTTKVKTVTQQIKTLIDGMVATMRSVDGLGLAAPQVGHGIRLTVIEYRPGKGERKEDAIPLMVLVNPKIISHSADREVGDEGCLSLPGIEIPIVRPRKIKVKTQTDTGETIQFRASGLLARIIQHEIDHLDGKLIIDHVKQKERVLRAYMAKRTK